MRVRRCAAARTEETQFPRTPEKAAGATAGGETDGGGGGLTDVPWSTELSHRYAIGRNQDDDIQSW